MSSSSNNESYKALSSEPPFIIKKEYFTTMPFNTGITTCHFVVFTNQIRKLVHVATQYRKYSRINRRMLVDSNLIREIFYNKLINTKQKNPLLISESLKQELIEWVEMFQRISLPNITQIQQYLPFQYVDPTKVCRPIGEVVVNLVSPSIVNHHGCCNPFYPLSMYAQVMCHQKELIQLFIDITQFVYKIKSDAVLILPISYYMDNEERKFYDRITDFAMR